MPCCRSRREQRRRRTYKKLTEALVWSKTYSADELEYLRHKQAPELENAVEPESWFYWQAFHHLRGSRAQGLEAGAIPFSEIAAYSEWLGLTCPVEKFRLARLVIDLDNAERSMNGKPSPEH